MQKQEKKFDRFKGKLNICGSIRLAKLDRQIREEMFKPEPPRPKA